MNTQSTKLFDMQTWLAKLPLFLVCLGFSCLTGTAMLAAQDRVYPKQGVPASGKIVDLSPVEVTIEVRGKNQKFEISDVRKITFDEEPNGLDRARENALTGQFDQALEEVKKIDVASIKNSLVRQDVEYYRYYSEGKLGLAGNGDKAASIKGLLALVNANRKTHHLYSVSELLGELAMGVGQPDKATSYFAMLESAPNPETAAAGSYHLAEVELSQAKTSEAKTRFNKLANAPSNSPEMARLKSLAEVGLAVCENLEGHSEAALNKLDAMIKKYDSTDQALFARIYNAKGACYLSLNQPKEALLNYLKTDWMFFTEAEAHAESLYHLKQLWAQVGDSARAAEAGSRLGSQYAASSWANK